MMNLSLKDSLKESSLHQTPSAAKKFLSKDMSGIKTRSKNLPLKIPSKVPLKMSEDEAEKMITRAMSKKKA